MAWRAAQSMGHVTLDRALRLVLLMAIEEDPGYEAAARRFHIRFLREQEPELNQDLKLTDALANARGSWGIHHEARKGLDALADLLAERRAREWPRDPMAL